MLLVGQHVTVVGLGVSGVAAVELCLRMGAVCSAIDRRPREALGPAADLPIDIRTDGFGRELLARADWVIVSPGVPNSGELAARLRPGAKLISELELAARCLSAPILAVGGTNGKTTTTALLASMLEASGLRTFCGGNLGVPLSRAVGTDWDAAVVEVSSYQLERVEAFRPRISVLLNITEDHLDRYVDLSAYANAKGNAFVRQGPEDVAVVPTGDSLCQTQASRGRGRLVRFGSEGDYFPQAGDSPAIFERASGRAYALTGSPLSSGHNSLNAAAAVAAARAFEVPAAAIERALLEFRLPAHRLQCVASVGGVRYYDDSKATNVAAAVAAVRSVQAQGIVLIAGGRDKGGAYGPLVEALAERGRAAIVLGEAAAKLRIALGERLPVHTASGLEAAVRLAAQLSRPGDAVLLSPACSSLDMFANYAERGRAFAREVSLLSGEASRPDKAGVSVLSAAVAAAEHTDASGAAPADE